MATAASACATVTGGFTLGLGNPATGTWRVFAYGTSCTLADDSVDYITSVLQLKEMHPGTYNHQILLHTGFANPGYKCFSASNGPAHGGGCYTHLHSGHPVKARKYFTWIPVRSSGHVVSCPDATGAQYMIGAPGTPGSTETSKYTVGGFNVKCSFADRWVARLSQDSPQPLGHPTGYTCSVGSAYASDLTAANGDCIKAGARAASAFFHWDPDSATFKPSARHLMRAVRRAR